MSRRASHRARAATLFFFAGILAGCVKGDPQQKSLQEPFGFSEIRRLANPSRAALAVDNAALSQQFTNHVPRIAHLYSEALSRFNGMYGDGIGPARGAPDYLACRMAFDRVQDAITTVPMNPSSEEQHRLWEKLSRCRRLARTWSSPPEFATFGTDLQSMAEGSMLVYRYALAASRRRCSDSLHTRSVCTPLSAVRSS